MNEAPSPRIVALLADGPRVANVGIRTFADSLVAEHGAVVHVDWRPPIELEPDLAALLEELG